MGFSGGGSGGSNSISGAQDVALNSVANDQALAYDTTLGKWTNKSLSSSGQSGSPGVVMMDSFNGATDDDKLTAALAYAAVQTQKPAVMLPTGRLVEFTQSQVIFDGMKIVGPPVVGFQNVSLSSGSLNPTRVRLNVGSGASSWLIAPGSGNRYNVGIRDISFESTNDISQFIHYPVEVGSLFSCTFHNLCFKGFYGVFGNVDTACAVTLVSFTGDWSIGNPRSTQLHLAGSDNVNMWMGGALNIGSSPDGSWDSGEGKYLIRFMTAKSNIGNIYFTADGTWRAFRLGGSATYQTGNYLSGFVVEGRNADAAASGALVSVTGGGWTIRDINLNYGMVAPSAISGAPDRGYIHQTGGVLHIDGVTTSRATGVSESVPIIYAAAGETIVRRAQRSAKGGAWVGRPRVQQPSTGTIIDTDPTVTLITQSASSLYTNTAEGGVNGAAVTTGGSGGASGAAFSVLSVGSSSSVTYDNSQAANGSSMSIIAAAAATETAYVGWTATSDAFNKASLKFWVRSAALPSADMVIAQMRSSAGSTGLLSMSLRTSGRLRISSDISSTMVLETVDPIVVNTWYCVEVQMENPTTSTGTVTLTTLDAALATVPNLSGSATGQNFGTNIIGTARVGKIGSAPAAALRIDEIAFRSGDSSLIGA